LTIEMKCMTLTDRGTLLQDVNAQNSMAIYLKGSENTSDLLLNPCSALVTNSHNAKDGMRELAIEFVNSMISEEAQDIIKTFGKDRPTNLLQIPVFSPAK